MVSGIAWDSQVPANPLPSPSLLLVYMHLDLEAQGVLGMVGRQWVLWGGVRENCTSAGRLGLRMFLEWVVPCY